MHRPEHESITHSNTPTTCQTDQCHDLREPCFRQGERVLGGDAAFRSKDTRFKRDMQIDQQSHVGPGSYAQQQNTIQQACLWFVLAAHCRSLKHQACVTMMPSAPGVFSQITTTSGAARPGAAGFGATASVFSPGPAHALDLQSHDLRTCSQLLVFLRRHDSQERVQPLHL